MNPALARGLGVELVAELARHIGDADALNEVLLDWHASLGSHDLGVVSAAALQCVFTQCLTTVPAADLEAGDVTFTERQTA